MRKLFALCSLACASVAYSQYSPQPVASMPLSQWQNSFGVNVHLEYGDGLYANINQVIADLQATGITHVRDGVPVPDYWASLGVPDVEQAMHAGIKFDLIASPLENLSVNMQQIDNLVADNNPGMVDAVEGYNEINNSGGMVNEAQAEAFQYSLYAAVHADAKLPGAGVLDFTGPSVKHNLTTMKNFADYGNTHPYPKGGAAPAATIAQNWADNYVGTTTGAVTEYGYATNQDGVDGVDETTQATYLLDGIFDNAKAGDLRTYPYELLDAYAGNSYGLFNFNDGSPKTSAQWLEDIHSIIPLDVPSKQTPVSVTEALVNADGSLTAGLPAGVQQLALTDSKGDIYLWTWNEQTVYNEAKNQGTQPGYQAFDLQIPGGNYTVSLFTPELDFAIPDAPVGSYNGSNYYVSYYSDMPICTIFRKN
jgi:hypothetical protein